MGLFDLKTIITFLIGSIVGFFIQKSLDKIYNVANRSMKYKKLKLNISKNKLITEKDLNILVLGHGVPSYELGDGLRTVDSRKYFYIDFPDDKKHLLPKEFRLFHEDRSFDGSSNFNELEEETGISNLTGLINKHRHIVAEDFINRRNGCHFNGNKYGVYNIDGLRRYGDLEKSSLEITLYSTDYFTHKVMKSIYKELKSQEHQISIMTNYNDIKNYRAFLTSFGVNALVEVDSINGKSLILTKRSINTTASKGKSWYSISMIEGLTQVDFDEYSETISLKQCIQRGLEEELGIPTPNRSNYYSDNDIKFFDLFISLEHFEIGITALVEIMGKYSFEEHIQNGFSKDRILEVDDMMPILLNKREIEAVINENINNFYPQSLYTLLSICARKGIRLSIKDNR